MPLTCVVSFLFLKIMDEISGIYRKFILTFSKFSQIINLWRGWVTVIRQRIALLWKLTDLLDGVFFNLIYIKNLYHYLN